MMATEATATRARKYEDIEKAQKMDKDISAILKDVLGAGDLPPRFKKKLKQCYEGERMNVQNLEALKPSIAGNSDTVRAIKSRQSQDRKRERNDSLLDKSIDFEPKQKQTPKQQEKTVVKTALNDITALIKKERNTGKASATISRGGASKKPAAPAGKLKAGDLPKPTEGRKMFSRREAAEHLANHKPRSTMINHMLKNNYVPLSDRMVDGKYVSTSALYKLADHWLDDDKRPSISDLWSDVGRRPLLTHNEVTELRKEKTAGNRTASRDDLEAALTAKKAAHNPGVYLAGGKKKPHARTVARHMEAMKDDEGVTETSRALNKPTLYRRALSPQLNFIHFRQHRAARAPWREAHGGAACADGRQRRDGFGQHCRERTRHQPRGSEFCSPPAHHQYRRYVTLVQNGQALQSGGVSSDGFRRRYKAPWCLQG